MASTALATPARPNRLKKAAEVSALVHRAHLAFAQYIALTSQANAAISDLHELNQQEDTDDALDGLETVATHSQHPALSTQDSRPEKRRRENPYEGLHQDLAKQDQRAVIVLRQVNKLGVDAARVEQLLQETFPDEVLRSIPSNNWRRASQRQADGTRRKLPFWTPCLPSLAYVVLRSPEVAQQWLQAGSRVVAGVPLGCEAYSPSTITGQREDAAGLGPDLAK